MPILSLEPALHPENLFECARTEIAHARWSVLHTRPRQEKSLARRLHEKGVPFFLPLSSNWLRVRGQSVQSFHPLFAGYVFLYGDAEAEQFAMSTRRVARAIAVADQGRLWHDLQQVHRLITSGAAIRTEDALTPGTPVEIQSGPLAGMRGVVVKSASGNRFVVKVDFIQRGASVFLEDCVLARLPDEPTRGALLGGRPASADA